MDSVGLEEGRLDGDEEGALLGAELEVGVKDGKRDGRDDGCDVGSYVGVESNSVEVTIDCLSFDEELIFIPPSMTTTRLITIAAAMPKLPKFLALIL